jgi:hypothetical protein
MSLSTRSFWLAVLSVAVFAPLAADAAKLDLYNPKKTYKDEKIAIEDPISRCITADFKKMYTDGLALAEKDALKWKDANGVVDARAKAAYDVYVQDIEFGWQAMQEPYCGFGAFGVSAAKKSFQKTLTRARAAFLTATKSLKPVVQAPVNDKARTLSAAALTVYAPSTTVVVVEPTPSLVSDPLPVPAPTPIVTSVKPSLLALTLTLKRGMKNDQVKALQLWLASKGYLDKEYATGYFGQFTEQAVIKVQLERKLISSTTSPGAGLIGPKTRTALNGS